MVIEFGLNPRGAGQGPDVSAGGIDDCGGPGPARGEALLRDRLDLRPQRDGDIGAGDHLCLVQDGSCAIFADGDQPPAGGAAQQLLGAGLEAGPTDQIAGPIPLGRERLEVLGRDLGGVADHLPSESLLRVDPGTIVPCLGPHDLALADDPAARREVALEDELAVWPELGKDDLGAPAQQPAVGSVDERQRAF